MIADPRYRSLTMARYGWPPAASHAARSLHVCSPFSTRRRSSSWVNSHLNLGNAAMFRLSGDNPRNSNSRISILV